MAEENPSAMNLDLNLGPVDNSSDGVDSASGSNPNVVLTMEDWFAFDNGPVRRVRDVVRHRSQRRRSLWRQLPVPPETRDLALELLGGIARPAGEVSVATEDDAKTCENVNDFLKDDVLGKKDDVGKNNGEEGSFFDCNICLDLAKEPVVTCCGHLFCWPCLYRWLHHHSEAKECPVCKGEVTLKNVTPIYGRGDSTRKPPNVDPTLKIPQRPHAHRVESWRQAIQRMALFDDPLEEMIRRLEGTYDRGLAQRQQYQNSDGHHQELQGPPDNDLRDNHHRLLHFLRGTISLRSFSELVSAGGRSSEPNGNSNHPIERSEAQLLHFDDRDSLSSIAAVIHSESQTMDTAVEIDSTVARSTSSSRRRNDASRTSDVNSGDSPVPRRRRLY